jgi:hypothetical protein
VTAVSTKLRHPGRAILVAMGLLFVVTACQPTVRIEAPKEPITINLNIKLEADVRVRLEDQAREDVSSNPIF